MENMPANEPFFTIITGVAVLFLAILLVRRRIIPSRIVSYTCPTSISRGQVGTLLLVGSMATSLLAFCTVMWELLG